MAQEYKDCQSKFLMQGLFLFHFGVTTPRDTQGLFMAQCSGVVPNVAWGNHTELETQPEVPKGKVCASPLFHLLLTPTSFLKVRVVESKQNRSWSTVTGKPFLSVHLNSVNHCHSLGKSEGVTWVSDGPRTLLCRSIGRNRLRKLNHHSHAHPSLRGPVGTSLRFQRC